MSFQAVDIEAAPVIGQVSKEVTRLNRYLTNRSHPVNRVGMLITCVYIFISSRECHSYNLCLSILLSLSTFNLFLLKVYSIGFEYKLRVWRLISVQRYSWMLINLVALTTATPFSVDMYSEEGCTEYHTKGYFLCLGYYLFDSAWNVFQLYREIKNAGLP